jgi:hypothetical protein
MEERNNGENSMNFIEVQRRESERMCVCALHYDNTGPLKLPEILQLSAQSYGK